MKCRRIQKGCVKSVKESRQEVIEEGAEELEKGYRRASKEAGYRYCSDKAAKRLQNRLPESFERDCWASLWI
jgi:hypothetical protein